MTPLLPTAYCLLPIAYSLLPIPLPQNIPLNQLPA